MVTVVTGIGIGIGIGIRRRLKVRWLRESYECGGAIEKRGRYSNNTLAPFNLYLRLHVP